MALINLPQIPARLCQERQPNTRCFIRSHYYKPISSHKIEKPPNRSPNGRSGSVGRSAFIRITKPVRLLNTRRNYRHRDANDTILPGIRKQTVQLQSNPGIITDFDRGGDNYNLREGFKSSVHTTARTKRISLPLHKRTLPSCSVTASKQRKPSRLIPSNCQTHSEDNSTRETRSSNEAVMLQSKSSGNNFSTALAQLSECT